MVFTLDLEDHIKVNLGEFRLWFYRLVMVRVGVAVYNRSGNLSEISATRQKSRVSVSTLTILAVRKSLFLSSFQADRVI
jgi:hypothetical protein